MTISHLQDSSRFQMVSYNLFVHVICASLSFFFPLFMVIELDMVIILEFGSVQAKLETFSNLQC